MSCEYCKSPVEGAHTVTCMRPRTSIAENQALREEVERLRGEVETDRLLTEDIEITHARAEKAEKDLEETKDDLSDAVDDVVRLTKERDEARAERDRYAEAMRPYTDPLNGDTWARCGDCGGLEDVVRPGKSQCRYCEALTLASGLQSERDTLKARVAELEERERYLDGSLITQANTVVHTIGGTVEGQPTHRFNYLQRLRGLIQKEAQLETERQARIEWQAEALRGRGRIAEMEGAVRELVCEVHDPPNYTPGWCFCPACRARGLVG